LKGFVSNDVLSIGDIVIESQDFAEVTKQPGLLFGQFDGILGLGYDTISVNHIVPPLYNMMKEKLIDEPIFTFRLGSSEDDVGEVSFGGIDKTAYKGEIKYVPVRRQALWEVELESIKFGDEELELKNTGAAIDTASSLIVMPVDIAEMLNTLIGATRSRSGQYTIDCSQVPGLPELSFYFGGTPYPLQGKDYVLEVEGECTSVFIGINLDGLADGVLWLIGTAFLRRYFTVYDLGRNAIGFAQAA
jgi:saccharopepsin